MSKIEDKRLKKIYQEQLATFLKNSLEFCPASDVFSQPHRDQVEEVEEQACDECDECNKKAKLDVIKHRSLEYYRVLGNWQEKIFADAWERENKENQILETLLEAHGIQPTQHEASIVATVIQWLGTNVGHCFLQRTLEEGGVLTRQMDLPFELSSDNVSRRKKAKKIVEVQQWCERNIQRYNDYYNECVSQAKKKCRRKIDTQLLDKSELEDLEFDPLPYPEKLSE